MHMYPMVRLRIYARPFKLFNHLPAVVETVHLLVSARQGLIGQLANCPASRQRARQPDSWPRCRGYTHTPAMVDMLNPLNAPGAASRAISQVRLLLVGNIFIYQMLVCPDKSTNYFYRIEKLIKN